MAMSPRAADGKKRAGATKQAAHRSRILDAARDAFSTLGYEDSSMGQIARSAQVGVATVYNHFKGGKATLAGVLFAELYNPLAERTVSELKAGTHPMRVLERFSRDLVTLSHLNLHLTNALLMAVQAQTVRTGSRLAEHDPRKLVRLRSIAQTLFAAAQDKGCIRTDYPPGELGMFYVNILLLRVMTRPEDPARDIFDWVWTLMMHGLTEVPS